MLTILLLLARFSFVTSYVCAVRIRVDKTCTNAGLLLLLVEKSLELT